LLPSSIISLKPNLTAIAIWYFLWHYSIVDEKWTWNPSIHGTKGYDQPRTTFGRTATIAIMTWWLREM
jgi:hypothetical protein